MYSFYVLLVLIACSGVCFGLSPIWGSAVPSWYWVNMKGSCLFEYQTWADHRDVAHKRIDCAVWSVLFLALFAAFCLGVKIGLAA